MIGASERPDSVGRAVLENLEAFQGRIYVVNPKRSSVLAHNSLHSVLDVPEVLDLAIIVAPAQSVLGIVRQCAQKKARAALIISAGFKEIGAAGIAMEREILSVARECGMRIIGPNCLGLMSPRVGLNATFAGAMARPGNLAFISQSGALCTAILDWSLGQNVGFSGFVSIGSMLDVGWSELITHFGDDPHTHGIVCYIESIGDARTFLSAAREVSRSKPVIVLKVGRTLAAARAAASHTGSLTGSDEALDAAFRRAGVLRVDTVAELFDMAEALAKQPLPAGPRLVIVTNAGGPGALSTDMLVRCGGQISQLSPTTRERLDTLLPAHWSHANPVDILGDADATRYTEAVQVVSQDPNSDGLLLILTPQKMTDPTAIAERLIPVAKGIRKPVLASWMGGERIREGEQILNQANIPTFAYPDAAAQAFEHMWRYGEMLRAAYETPILDDSLSAVQQQDASDLIERISSSGRTLLTSLESSRVLKAYGIPHVESILTKDENEAARAAKHIGFPVVLKLHSEIVTHKTDVAGVQLNLETEQAVREAFRNIETACLEHASAAAFGGCLVQPMISRHGYELIVGSSTDTQLGPVLMFGSGGQLVEILHDVTLELPPLNTTLARRMLERTKIHRALQGVRGKSPVNIKALQALLIRFSELVLSHPRIAEIEINPLLASDEGLIALDARVVLHPTTISDEQLPRTAIRPYPRQYTFDGRTSDGTVVLIRPIRAEDEPKMVAFHRALSEQSVYLRYFEPLKLEQRIAHEHLSRSCFIDYDRELVLVAEHRSTEGPTILGMGKLTRLADDKTAEFALLVGDAWQRRGLGKQLLERLVQVARSEGLKFVVGCTLASNHPMQRLARKVGFEQCPNVAGHEYDLKLEL